MFRSDCGRRSKTPSLLRFGENPEFRNFCLNFVDVNSSYATEHM